MALKETVVQVRELLSEMSCDLEKAIRGNKMAAQRVRTASVAFTKVAKVFRKESIAAEKGGRKPSKSKAPISLKKKR